MKNQLSYYLGALSGYPLYLLLGQTLRLTQQEKGCRCYPGRKLNGIFKASLFSLSILFMTGTAYSISKPPVSEETYALTITVPDLQNSTGVVQFTLYNKEGSIPDEHYKKYYQQLESKITDNSATITFENIPEGVYAINILHDENENGVIDKGWFLPIEGIGFSNLQSINPLNRPSFKKAKFELNTDKTIKVKIIYM